LLQRIAFAASRTVITSGVPLKYDVISLSINDLLLPFTGITILTFTLLPLFIIHIPLEIVQFRPVLKHRLCLTFPSNVILSALKSAIKPQAEFQNRKRSSSAPESSKNAEKRPFSGLSLLLRADVKA
jgi:hypothetical protein